MNGDWIRQNLLSDSGFKRRFAHEIQLFKGPLSQSAYESRNISTEIAATATSRGSVEDLMNLLLRDATGHWLYAGWIDQAVLHIGPVRRGGMNLFATMLAEIDRDQVDQSGDMLVAFIQQGRESVLTIEASPDHSLFTIRLLTESESRSGACNDRSRSRS